jgi:ATP synthase I chain
VVVKEVAEVPVAVGERTVRRIVLLIPVLGMMGAAAAALWRGIGFAEGVVLGSGLAWLNFRWLRRGLEAITTAAAARGKVEKPNGQAGIYLAATFRYALIGLAVYVIFTYLHLPVLSVVLGLCTLAIAVLAASVWEILQSLLQGV